MPVVGLWRRGWWRHCLLRLLLLDIHWRRRRHGNHRGICVIRRIIRHSKTIASIAESPIAIAAIAQAKAVSTEAKAGIKAADTIETYSTMAMMSTMMVTSTAMMASSVVTSSMVAPSMVASPAVVSASAPTPAGISAAILRPCRTSGDRSDHEEDKAN